MKWAAEIPLRLQLEREREGLLQCLVFMAQPKIAALKQAIISLPVSHTVALWNVSPLSPASTTSCTPHPPFSSSLGLSIPSRPALPGSLSLVLWEPLRKSFAAVVFYSTGTSYQPGLALPFLAVALKQGSAVNRRNIHREILEKW